MRKYERSLHRLPLSETITAAEAQMQTSGADSAAKEALSAAIQTAKNQAEDESVRVRNLEKAIHSFAQRIPKTEILGFKVEGCDAEPVINTEARTVDVYVDDSVDLSGITAQICASEGAEVFPDFRLKRDFTNPVRAVVKNGAAYSVWTVAVHQERRENTLDAWWNWYGDSVSKRDNILRFEKSDSPFMLRGNPVSEITFTVKPDRLDDTYGLRLIFDSANSELITDGLEQKNSFFEFAVTKHFISLYRVEGGEKSILYGGPYNSQSSIKDLLLTESYFSPGQFNTVHISCTEEAGRKRVQISVNGHAVIDTLCHTNMRDETGYVGIYAPASGISAEVE